MARKELDLNRDSAALDASTESTNKKPAEKPKNQKNKKGAKQSPKFFQRIAKVFREMISELKKVDWPPFRRTKNNPGVLANLGIVVVVVLFFLIIITLFDMGLGALLRLLTQVQV